MSKPVGITDTILRDAHQSLLATRMRTEDMLPVAEKLDQVGYHSLEVWGGATFDTCMRFLNEDPWERLRTLKQHIKKTPLQMLLRGQNVVGYRHYADDIVDRFVEKARENGMDIFRIFDALNDPRNMERAMTATKRVGGHVQAAISYTISPVHSIEGFVALAKQFVDMGADSICIKDMAGLISPYDAYELTRRLKEEIDLPIQLHCHYTSGMASLAVLKAIEAGIDVVDTALSTMSLGTSQPPTESIVSTLKGTPRDTGLDLELLSELAKYFGEVRRKYKPFEGELIGVDTNVLIYQVPGGMISNLVSQLREQNAVDKLDQVLAEVPRVREDMGYPPLVTPSSQIVGTQAVLNVLMGERYKVIPKEVQQYVRGFYGHPPAPVSEELKRRVLGDEEPIQGRPADVLEPEWEKAKAEVGDLAKSDEDVLSYALFPQVALEFLRRRETANGAAKEIIAAIAAALPAPPPEAAGAPTGDGSAWKWVGRREALAADPRRWRYYEGHS